tara:strand:- start:3930 stop:4619 length:690 start_codon:yes stop_codon:yes gene_type:complete
MQEIKKEMYQKYADYAHSSCFVENHLGGCGIEGDTATHYPIMWSHLVSKFKIKSVLDVGCGFGYSLKFFEDLGCEVLGVEGSDKVIELTPLKDKILHVDYTASEFVPEKTYDLCWSCEFVEHVKEEFSPRFISTFKKSNFLAMTFAGVGQGGHHHVNENSQAYWVSKLEENGFKFELEFTEELRLKAYEDFKNPCSPVEGSEHDHLCKEGKWNYPHHFIERGLFFSNSH